VLWGVLYVMLGYIFSDRAEKQCWRKLYQSFRRQVYCSWQMRVMVSHLGQRFDKQEFIVALDLHL